MIDTVFHYINALTTILDFADSIEFIPIDGLDSTTDSTYIDSQYGQIDEIVPIGSDSSDPDTGPDYDPFPLNPGQGQWTDQGTGGSDSQFEDMSSSMDTGGVDGGSDLIKDDVDQFGVPLPPAEGTDHPHNARHKDRRRNRDRKRRRTDTTERNRDSERRARRQRRARRKDVVTTEMP